MLFIDNMIMIIIVIITITFKIIKKEIEKLKYVRSIGLAHRQHHYHDCKTWSTIKKINCDFLPKNGENSRYRQRLPFEFTLVAQLAKILRHCWLFLRQHLHCRGETFCTISGLKSEIRFSITYTSFNRASRVLLVDKLLLITSVSPSRTSWHPPQSPLSPHLAWSHPLFPSSFWFSHLPSDWFTASAIIVSINLRESRNSSYFVFGESKNVPAWFWGVGHCVGGRGDTIVSYNNALFLQRERNPADLVEPLFAARCSIIRSDLKHCSTFTSQALTSDLRLLYLQDIFVVFAYIQIQKHININKSTYLWNFDFRFWIEPNIP